MDISENMCFRTTVGQRDLRPQPAVPKRALFQSPDEPPVRPGFQTVAKRVPRRRLFADLNKPAQEPPHGGGRYADCKSLTNHLILLSSYDVSSWLASQPFVNNRKRAREDSIEESNPKRRCPRRSLDFSDASPSQTSQISDSPVLTMTTVHKQVSSYFPESDRNFYLTVLETSMGGGDCVEGEANHTQAWTV